MVDLVMDDTRERMAKAIEHVRVEFANVRTGRASPALVENLLVDYYGAETPLKQLANFSVPEPRLLVVSPFDKGAMAMIEKAIVNADLGLNPSNDGVVIRLGFPALTEERRKSFVKIVRTKAEEGKVALRGVRRHARQELENLEKEQGLSKDDLERLEKVLDKMTQDEVAVVDALLSHKEHELLEV
ncbi:MAG: ribosome recycling factor [Acidobacteriota bacterium]|nr:ribosome recycling factor [Acidobacteriota bacterium]MDE3031377.1 ribosome recycling factor [Acidobacteriota bacterium]MDE3092932.1 ribosome recycling factor [Acidobacteriota bacterium]MDE3139957.1 ribosome recycling factor [Acidobacteriota bacterium]MDE3146513.1 ribosome recycling factor [Acidobacteriota bacterium]